MRFLKTDASEIPSPMATAFAGQAIGYSPYVTREPLFQSARDTSSAQALEMKFIDPRIGDEWDRAVAQHPDATIFHTSGWARVLCDTYGHAPQYFSLSEGERPVALVPMMEVKSAVTRSRGVCLPFSDSCAPLIFGGSDGGTLADRLIDLARARNWKYFELRGSPQPEAALPAREKFYGHTLDLTKLPNELFENFASPLRRAIRKAERSGLSTEITSETSAIGQFYRLHNQTRRRHGIPPQPLSFFENIHQHVIKPGLGFVVMAYLDARPVAGAVFFHFGENALFKFGASDDRFQEHRPNNLVMWEGIKRARELGSRKLHLGRTDLAHAGLRRFKLSLGASEEVLSYFRFDIKAARWMNERPPRSSTLPGMVFRRLPLTVNKLAGTLLYPHLH